MVRLPVECGSGIVPDAREVAAAANTVDLLLQAVSAEVFGLDARAASFTWLLGDPELRDRLEEAQARSAASDFGFALDLSALAFERLLRVAREKEAEARGGSYVETAARLTAKWTNFVSFRSSAPKVAEAVEDLARAIRLQGDKLDIVALGFPLPEYRRFRAITPHVYGMADGSATLGTRSTPSRESAEYAIQFIELHSVRLIGGDIPNPTAYEVRRRDHAVL